MRIPIKMVIFTTGIPPLVKGSSNIVTDTNSEIWWDTDVRLLFVKPRAKTIQGAEEDTHILCGEGADMRLKFPAEWPGWEAERKESKRKAS